MKQIKIDGRRSVFPVALNANDRAVRSSSAVLAPPTLAGEPMQLQSNALTFTRPCHSGQAHRITVDIATLRPLTCTCEAGRGGWLCWAVIDIAATDLVPIAYNRWRRACGETDIRAAARLLLRTRTWARAARELQRSTARGGL